MRGCECCWPSGSHIADRWQQQQQARETASPPSPPPSIRVLRGATPKHTHRRCLPSSCHRLGTSRGENKALPCIIREDQDQTIESSCHFGLEWDFFMWLAELLKQRSLYIFLMLEESWVRMKQFTMQIEAWEEMEAAPCILGAVCVFSSLAQQFGDDDDDDDYCSRNNSPGGKLGINFKGNRSDWMLIMLITHGQKCHRKVESGAQDTGLCVAGDVPSGSVCGKWLLSLVI
ncbi:uncharacterized protein LOC116407674 isoform X2 [Xenopus tropicalis]|uniref:Uncharacterized protein LOC116407674 isoform X2 n=1 Tax=Xenopus tropicalis TaxID=8364 RepID=A0A8J1IXY1_XENTR|nr:uncharacterized protein LOC116407674 isoform X2 [Xenopus tropicalis]